MKICFLSLNSYPMLTGKNLGYAGGAEIEQVHLGLELLAQGYDVYFITYRHGEKQIENVGAIKVIKTYEREKAGEINALLRYRFVWSSLKKANADVYFHEAGATGVLPLFCCLNRKKFVYRIPSDVVVLSKPLSGNYSFNSKIMVMLEIKRATIAVPQSNFQRRVLKERFGVEGVVIKNGLIIPKVNCEKQEPPIVLWVGSISSVKRPRLFIELAKSIPYTRFEMVGGKTKEEPQLYEEIAAAAQELPNVEFHGFVPYHNINEYFKKASIFVNTSRIEGFPNTFIQAWAHYTPVASLSVDPDKIIRNNKIGFSSGTFEQLVSDVVTLLKDKELRKTMSEKARKYAEKEHDIRKTVKKYIKIFEEIL